MSVNGSMLIAQGLSRQLRVGAALPGMQGAFGRGVEVRDLACGMHARVGAAGDGDRDRVVGDGGQGALHFGLNAGGVPLALPAVVVRAVVFEAAGEAEHGGEAKEIWTAGRKRFGVGGIVSG